MKHLDLFSGIGGFALAADRVFGNIEHTFIEIDPFCQAVLRKHWPKSEIYGDIRKFIADAERERREGEPFILTGGFPCQPFSQAGRRRGTEDDRYLWPEMFRVVQIFHPTWVIAENVRGLASWNDGLVLETVCSDLESEKYEVQPFIIPACSVGAPHRRDRIWLVANRNDSGSGTPTSGVSPENRSQDSQEREHTLNGSSGHCEPTTDTRGKELGGIPQQSRKTNTEDWQEDFQDWSRDWREVAIATCHDGVDDGISRRMGEIAISGARWRKEALKSYGNAIVPQIAEILFRNIKICQEQK